MGLKLLVSSLLRYCDKNGLIVRCKALCGPEAPCLKLAEVL